MILTLPYPPTVNTYYRNVKGRTLISKKGREYRKAVIATVPMTAMMKGKLSVRIIAHVPDKRRRDLDNLLKAPLDALQAAGVYLDDSQIDSLFIARGSQTKGGSLEITITRLSND